MRVIIGIDPGTTTAVAVLNTEGKLLEIKSKKGWGFDSVVEWVNEQGSILAIGTDKAKVPGFISNVAAVFSARIVHPRADLKMQEKSGITEGFECRNRHEYDALASGLVAFRRYERALSNVAKFAKLRKREDAVEELRELVIKHGMSRSAALEFLEKPEDQPIMVKELTKRIPTAREVMRLYNSLIDEREHSRKKGKQVIELRKELSSLRKDKSVLNRQLQTLQSKKAQKQKKEFQRARWKSMESHIKELQNQIYTLNSRLEDITKFIGEPITVVRKMKSLSAAEINRQRLTKVIIVDNPAEFSERSLKVLEGLHLVSTRHFPRPVRAACNTCTVDRIGGNDFGSFVLVKDEMINSWFQKVDVTQLIDEYKNSR